MRGGGRGGFRGGFDGGYGGGGGGGAMGGGSRQIFVSNVRPRVTLAQMVASC